MTDSVYWIWLQLLFGAGTRRAELFMNYFESPQELYDSIHSGGVGMGMLEKDEQSAWQVCMERAANIQKRALAKGCEIITPDHPKYPPLLQHIYSKPAALYVRGDLACLTGRLAVGMVGTRQHTDYGKQAALMLAGGLAHHGVTVVSGLAKGIDTFCHEAALDAGGITVGILGCGLDVDYPKGSVPLKQRICQNGAVLTEYPLGMPPMPGNFPLRNRILSGLCRGVVVVEADENSGSLVTANHALDQGRDVFAVPGNIFSARHKGGHKLIRNSCAKLVESVGDVLEEYGLAAQKKTPQDMHNSRAARTNIIKEAAIPQQQILPQPEPERKPAPEGLSKDGAALLDALCHRPTSVEELMEKSGLSVAGLQTALTELEIYGLIKVCPGRAFALI